MSQFLEEVSTGKFLTDSVQSIYPPQGQLVSQTREQDVKYDTGLTEEERIGLDTANDIAFEDIKTRPLAPAGMTSGLLSTLIEDGEDLETLTAAAIKKAEIDKTLNQMENFSSVDLALATDPTVGALLWRTEHRAQRARDMLLNKAEEYADGFGGQVLEFIDQMAYDTVVGIKNVRSSLAGEGTEVSQLSDQWEVALRTYDDQQLDDFIQERLNDIEGSFMSGSESQWRVLRELQAMEAAGAVLWDEQMGRLAGAASALDIATLGVSGVKTIAKAGRSTIGRLRSTAGTKAATDTFVNTSLVVRGGIDGEILEDIPQLGTRKSRIKADVEDAVVLDDVMPSASSSTIHTGPKSAPVSAGKVSQAVAGNKFVRNFINSERKFAFGTFDLGAAASSWAKVQAARLSEASGTSLIDFDIVNEGLQQAKVSFTMGKTTGDSFKTFKAAQDAANKVPNSVVIDTRTGLKATSETPSTEFALKVDMRVPLQETISELNLSEVRNKTILGRVFGSAGLHSNKFFSNLADAADYGAGKIHQDFKTTLKEINKLPKADRQAMDDVLTTLRDTPNDGNARSWLRTDEFISAFQAVKGEAPSRAVLKAYEDTVQMSDFNWWVAASDRLTSLVNQKATVVKVGDTEAFAFPSRRVVSSLKEETTPVYAWDASLQHKVNIKTLNDETPIMEFATQADNGAKYVFNFAGNTRTPELTDALSYNAGGPRSNPDITWFVGNSDNNWATLIGAKSQRDADIAVGEYNTIADAVQRVVGKNLDDYSTLSRAQKKELSAVVKANNKWNPEIEDIDDFMTFTAKRGVPANKRVVRRGRGEKVSSVIHTADTSLVDLNLDQYIAYHRHDEALLEFGGVKTSNPDPLLAIQTQYNHMVTRGAQTQYRMNHPTAWRKAVQSAIESGDVTDVPLMHPMTDEAFVRNFKITGKSDVARKLRQEQSVINRRLGMFDSSQSALPTNRISEGLSNAAEWAVETIHNKTGNKGGDVARWIKGGVVDGASNKLLSLGFFQRMASLDQVLLQASHFIPIVSISPKNGMRGLQLATVIRQAARSADESTWNILARNLRVTSGIDEKDFNDLMEHMLDSGRGYMRGAVAEDPRAGMGNSMLSKAKDIVSTPYYAGENYSATLSRITAFLDTKDAFPRLDTKSRAFWNEVQARDRDLSFALNKAQKSVVQSDGIARVATQWTSYPLRTIENVLFNNNLSPAERARLGAATTMLWGLSGLGLHKWAMDSEESGTLVGGLIANGADEAIDALLGVRVGDRLAFNPIELFERAYGTVANPFETVPAFTLVGDTAKPALSAVQNVFSGRWGLLSHDAATLARAWKVVDAAVMAKTMYLEDARITKTGSAIEKEFTPVQEVLQAIGIKPTEATEIGQTSNVLYSQKVRKEKAVKQGLTPFKLAVEALEEGKYGKGLQLLKDSDAIVQAYGLSDTYLAEVREEIFMKVGFDRINWMTMELIKAGYDREALEFNNLFKGE